MQRIFTRDVAGVCTAGQIMPPTDTYMDWDGFQRSALRFHGVKESLDAYSLPVEEAARRYVESLQRRDERERREARAGAPR